MEETNIKHLQLRLPIGMYERLRSVASRETGDLNPNLQKFCAQMIGEYLLAADTVAAMNLNREDQRAIEAAKRILQTGSAEVIQILRGTIRSFDSALRPVVRSTNA
jgi:hypothetical protein